MTLVEAFRILAPLIGDPEVDAARAEAARIVLHELQTLPVRLDNLERFREDALQTALLRLVRKGPRSLSESPDSDAGVRAYLRRSLLQNAISELRDWFETCEELPDDVRDAGAGPETGLDLEWARSELRKARAQLMEEIAPELGAATEGILQDLVDLSEGRGSFDALVAREARPDEASRGPRVRLDQRHSRARAAVRKHVDRASLEGRLSVERAAALYVVLEGLYRRAQRVAETALE